MLLFVKSALRREIEPEVPSAIISTRQIRRFGFEGLLKVERGPAKKVDISRSAQP